MAYCRRRVGGVAAGRLRALGKGGDLGAARPRPAACSEGQDGGVVIQGNGTRTCCGGWQFVYTGIRGGQAYRIRTRVHHKDLGNARDSLVAMVLWDRWNPTDARSSNNTPWNYLLPKSISGSVMGFDGRGHQGPPG